MDIWYSLVKSTIRAYLALFIRSIHVLGCEELPQGPKIIVANHTNVTDGFVLPFLVKEKLHYLIQSDTFTVPVIGRLLALADQIPVYISRGQEALDLAKEKLRLGHCVAIFPEGRLNDGRSFHRAGIGAAKLAAESGAMIVPVGFFVPDQFARQLTAHFHGRQVFARWQFGGHCFVHFGDPWDLSQMIRDQKNYRELRQFTDKIMSRITELVRRAEEEAKQRGLLS